MSVVAVGKFEIASVVRLSLSLISGSCSFNAFIVLCQSSACPSYEVVLVLALLAWVSRALTLVSKVSSTSTICLKFSTFEVLSVSVAMLPSISFSLFSMASNRVHVDFFIAISTHNLVCSNTNCHGPNFDTCKIRFVRHLLALRLTSQPSAEPAKTSSRLFT